MKDKKLQIFVSSTFTDLKDERQAAVEAILSSGHIPAGMELFSAGDESQMSVIKRWIDESDVYLLILGGRYGSIDEKSGKSYTHLEYEYAIEKQKPLFAVVIKEEALEEKVKLFGTSVLEKSNMKELLAFRSTVLNNLVKFWEDTKDIKISIHETISEFVYRKDLVGWVRGDQTVNTAFLAEEIARLTKENSELRNKINSKEFNAPSYAGLAYFQLEELLKREKINFNKVDYNLFDFLLLIARSINKDKVVSGEKKSAFLKLYQFKILNLIASSSDGARAKFGFTEDGHNFYLRALLMTRETQSMDIGKKEVIVSDADNDSLEL